MNTPYYAHSPKTLDDASFEEKGIFFHLNYKEGEPLFHADRTPTNTYKEYVHTFFQKHIEPVRQEFFNPQILANSNPQLKSLFDYIFYLFYNELMGFTHFKGTGFISEDTWEHEIERYTEEYTDPEQLKVTAHQNLQAMNENQIKIYLREVVEEVISEVENKYTDRVDAIKSRQKEVIQKVSDMQASAKVIAGEVATLQTKHTFSDEKNKLMETLFPVDDTFLQKDKTRAFYYENLKKREQLKDMEKEIQFKNREMTVREKELNLTQREKEFAHTIIQKDLEIERKMIELVQSMNLHELDKKQLEVAYSLLQVEKEGVAQARELVQVEKSLMQVRQSQFESRVRELKLNIQEQKFNFQQLKANLDFQERKLNIGNILLRAKKELKSLDEQKETALSELRNYNHNLHKAKDNFEYYSKKKESLKNEIERLNYIRRQS